MRIKLAISLLLLTIFPVKAQIDKSEQECIKLIGPPSFRVEESNLKVLVFNGTQAQPNMFKVYFLDDKAIQMSISSNESSPIDQSQAEALIAVNGPKAWNSIPMTRFDSPATLSGGGLVWNFTECPEYTAILSPRGLVLLNKNLSDKFWDAASRFPDISNQ